MLWFLEVGFHSYWCRLHVCTPSPTLNLHIEVLDPSVMVLKGETLGGD